MKKNTSIYILGILLLSFFICGGTATAKELKLASSTAVPPFIIVESNSGIELDIVREALKQKGHHVSFEHLPFPRAVEKMKAKEFDGALTISESANLKLGKIYYSDSHISFQNVAITLKSSNLDILEIADLSGKSIGTFQYAKEYLGTPFANMANSNSAYRELPNSTQIIPMLFQKRVEVIVMEVNIFKYLRTKTRIIDTSAPVTIHRIFPENPFKVVFLDEKIQQDFNFGLKTVRGNGRYDNIIKQYTE